MIGLSFGFIFVVVVFIIFEFFGFFSVGVNYNILIINIFVGFFVYGFLVVVVYDFNVGLFEWIVTVIDLVVCMGRYCYFWIFMWWGCIFFVGFVLSLFLFFRIRFVYDWFESDRIFY